MKNSQKEIKGTQDATDEASEERFDLVENRFIVEVPTKIRAGSFSYYCYGGSY